MRPGAGVYNFCGIHALTRGNAYIFSQLMYSLLDGCGIRTLDHMQRQPLPLWLTGAYTHSAVWNATKIAHSFEIDISTWCHVHLYWSATYRFDKHKLPNLCQGSIYYGYPDRTNPRDYPHITVAIKAACCTCLNSCWNLISIKSYFLFSIISRYWDGTCSWMRLPLTIKTGLSCLINYMTDAVLVTQRAMASASSVLCTLARIFRCQRQHD